MKSSFSSAFDHVNQGAAYRLFQESIDPIILTESSGLIVQANERTFELLGCGMDEIKGRYIADLFQAGQALPDFSTLPLDTRQLFDGIMSAKQNRELLHVKVHATQYALENHSIVQWILHDITRQVKLEKLRQDLAAMLVHDLQGPLGNVLSSLELATNELADSSSDTLRLMLDVAFRSSQHLQYLVDSLMDISHLEAGHPISSRDAVDVGELIDFVFAFEEPDLEQRGITVTHTVTSGLPKVMAEESMLRRVLLNLLDNALKHSKNGQSVDINARLEENANMVRISVIDQGQGVPEAYRDLIFEKFQRVRTSSSSSGLGLGLAFCRLAVEAHGGRIWVEDAPSGGACFCFTMPTAPDKQSTTSGNAHI